VIRDESSKFLDQYRDPMSRAGAGLGLSYKPECQGQCYKTAGGPSVHPLFCMWVPRIQPNRTLTSLIVISSTSLVRSWPCGATEGTSIYPIAPIRLGSETKMGWARGGHGASILRTPLGREQVCIAYNGADASALVKLQACFAINRYNIWGRVFLIRADTKSPVS